MRAERSTLGRTFDWIMLAAFAMSVLVQVNDPDPWLWIAIYGAAGIVTALLIAARLQWWMAAAVAVVAAIWAATIAPRVIGKVPFMSMFGAFEMQNIGIEESREMYGLLLIALWCAVAAWRSRIRS